MPKPKTSNPRSRLSRGRSRPEFRIIEGRRTSDSRLEAVDAEAPSPASSGGSA